MARKPRIHIPGGIYHVMLRGNGGQKIFYHDEDYSRLFRLIQEGISRFDYRVHAFCCMSNHVHFALQIGSIPLSRIMQNLSFRYTRWVNQRKRRIGHLFQGRYKAILVDGDSYLLQLTRYIHLNPIRAGLVKNLEDFRWSSHRAYLGKASFPWLTTEWVLSQFGKRMQMARKRYQEFVSEGVQEGHREEFHRGTGNTRVLGDDHFVDRILSKNEPGRHEVPSIGQIIQRVSRTYGVAETDLKSVAQRRALSEARAVVGWLVREGNCGTLTEAGRRLNRDVATMSSAVQRLLDRSMKEPPVRRRLERLRSILK